MRSFALVVALCLASSACTETQPAPTEAEARKFVEDANRSMLWQIGLMLLAAAGGGLLFDMAQAVSIQRLMTATSTALHVGLWDRMLRQSPSFFRKFTAGDLENRSEAITRMRFALNETVIAQKEDAVLFADRAAPPMNLLGPASSAVLVGVTFADTMEPGAARRSGRDGRATAMIPARRPMEGPWAPR